MAAPKDEIPDLLPGAGAGGAPASPSKGSPGIRGAAPRPPSPRVSAPASPAVPAPSPVAIDEFEFDVLGVTSQRSQELIEEFLGGSSGVRAGAPSAGLALDYGAAERRASPRQASSPDLDLEADFSTGPRGPGLELTEEAEDVVLRRSSFPPEARRLGSEPPPRRDSVPPGSGPALAIAVSPVPGISASPRVGRGSVPPARPSVPPAPVSAAAGSMELGSVPAPRRAPDVAPPSYGGAGEMDLFDFDAEFGGVPNRELAVAVPLPSEDALGYPTGETPRLEDLGFELAAVEERSGFGPRPKNGAAAPLYALRVTVGAKQLRRERDELAVALERREEARDRALAALAEGFREKLSAEERFRVLFEEVRRSEGLEAERATTLAQTTGAGTTDLAELDRRLEEARRVRLGSEAKRDEQTRVVVEAGRVVQRAQSQKKRLEIEMRNIERLALERVPEGSVMPPDLALRYVPVQRDHELAVEALRRAEEQERALRALLRGLEDEARRALGDEQRVVAEREGFLLTHSGEVSEVAGLVSEARRTRESELARAGRAILALRGEVPVDEALRRELFGHDEAVTRAARELALVERALASADFAAVRRGRNLAVAVGLLLGAALVVLALR